MSDVALRDDPWQLKRMEDNLSTNVLAALETANLSSIVYGVFSLEQLMARVDENNRGQIVVGVAYMGCRPTTNQATRPNTASAASAIEPGNVASQLEYLFTVMYAVPEDEVNSQRYPANAVMTAIRRGVVGKTMQIGNTAKATTSWQFVYERPEVDESEPTLLLYTQVWRLKLPLTSQ